MPETQQQEQSAPAAAREAILEVDDVTLQFGGVTALDGVSFDIARGEILGLIGPNGAGKTTCFNVMTGVYKPTSGEARFLGRSLTGHKRFEITRMGIARTFQNIRLFRAMTAYENVMVGGDTHSGSGLLRSLIRTPKQRAEERANGDRAHELLELVGIADRADELAANLSYGDQRRLEIARALATGPQLLCLDEPAAGFNPAEKQALVELIRKVRAEGYTVLLIEHDMSLVMNVCDRIVVLEFGQKIAEGAPAQIREDPAVIAAYLGLDEEEYEEEVEESVEQQYETELEQGMGSSPGDQLREQLEAEDPGLDDDAEGR